MTFGGNALVLEAATGHPNEMKFKGVLLRLDEPSTKPPHGSDGHKILVTTSVAKSRLNTLIGMGLNYSPDLKQHAQRRKVGVITRAWVQGKDLWVEARIWKHDFPEAERDLKRPGLGMSMEINQVVVKDQNASVWELSDFCFLGATILEQTAAAYARTQAIAAAAKEKNTMAEKKKVAASAVAIDEKRIARIAARAAVSALDEKLKPLTAAVTDIQTRFDAMSVEAAVDDDEEIEVEGCNKDGEEMETGKKKKLAAKKMADKDDDGDSEDDMDDDEDMDSSEEDMDSAEDISHGNLEEMGPEEDADDDEPGQSNREAKNKGRKTMSENKLGKTVSSARLAASLQRESALRANLEAAQQTIKTFKKRFQKLESQVAAATDAQSRRSAAVVSADVSNLLRKGGVNAGELMASGQKLEVEEVDALLASVGLEPLKRIQLKTEMARAGLMVEGRVNRQ